MTSISSTNSVIIPGEKAYQMDLKLQMKMQASNMSTFAGVNYANNNGHRTSKSQTVSVAHQMPTQNTHSGTVRVQTNPANNLAQQYRYSNVYKRTGNMNEQNSDANLPIHLTNHEFQIPHPNQIYNGQVSDQHQSN